jgi:hypothetical protein
MVQSNGPVTPRPQGEALTWDDMDLHILSMPSKSAIAEAEVAWRRYAPKPLRRTLVVVRRRRIRSSRVRATRSRIRRAAPSSNTGRRQRKIGYFYGGASRRRSSTKQSIVLAQGQSRGMRKQVMRGFRASRQVGGLGRRKRRTARRR